MNRQPATQSNGISTAFGLVILGALLILVVLRHLFGSIVVSAKAN